ncbi:MAG TPA: rhomboid family intramembrane serine protease [Candidatus Koribacter sp.]|jgi:membrane associated rhomboid family serine protease
MLIPLGTSVQTVRRIPWVTFSLIVINAAVCLCTSWMTDQGTIRFGEVRRQIVEFHGYYPQAHGSNDAEALIAQGGKTSSINLDSLDELKGLLGPSTPPLVGRVQRGELTADEAMQQLSERLDQAEHDSFMWKYAFHSFHPKPVSLLTATFLHEGFFHLLGNMWFLYLVGTLLEAEWGYWLFGSFYLVAGVVSLLAQALAHPNSLAFVLGASGAVAGCMGAFLVRFPKVKVNFLFVYLLGFRNGAVKFSIPSYVVLSLWVALEVLSGLIAMDYVAHWAHVGGFVFGIAVAFVVMKSGVEEKINREDPSLTWQPDQAVLAGMALIEEKKFAEAQTTLREYLRLHPDSIEGYETLLRAQQGLDDRDGEREVLGILCRLTMRSGHADEAWGRYEEWLAAGGGPPAPPMWLDLCRFLEGEKSYQRAADECEKLVNTFPDDPLAFEAMLIAGRIHLERLHNRAEAERWYRRAQDSKFYTLQYGGVVQAGLQKSKAALAK